VTSSYTSLWINGDGRIGKSASSKRYKKSIVRNPALPDVFAVPLARYVMRGDDALTPRYGHIAEDLAENPATEKFVVYDAEGRPDAFDTFSLMHAQIEELRRRNDALAARLTALEQNA